MSDDRRASDIVQFSALFAGVAFLVTGNGLQGTLVGVRAGLEAMAQETIGAVMSAYFVGFAIASIYGPLMVQRVGHIRAFAALAAIASALALGHAIFALPVVWVALRVLSGACYAGLTIIVESWLNASSNREQRGRVLAIYMIVIYAGRAMSQQLLNLAPPESFVLFCLVSVCLSMALVPITLSNAGVPGIVAAHRLNLPRLYAISPLALLGAFMLGCSVSALLGMGPTFAQAIGLDNSSLATFMSVMLVGALVMQWPLGWLSDRVDRRQVIAGSALVATFAAALLAIASGEDLYFLLILSFLLGGAILPIYAIVVAHANDHIKAEEFVAAASGLVLVYGVGSAFGPLAASVLMGQIGPTGLFLFMAIVMGLYALYGVCCMMRRAATAPKDKEDYVAVPQTSHVAMRLHRRGANLAYPQDESARP